LRKIAFLTSIALLAGCTARPNPAKPRVTACEANTGTTLGSPRLADVAPVARRLAPAGIVHLERATDPDRAMRWRRLTWQDENGRVAGDALPNALQERAANVAYRDAAGLRALTAADWVARGPVNVGGRTRSILIDPRNTDRLWAGAVSGGIWHSEDRGATWTQVNDWLPNLAICCLTMDPQNPDIMYAGTGEGFFNSDAVGGTGIYRSIDGGVTWNLLPSTATWDNVCRIAISPANSNTLLAAKRYGGIQRSTNGGQSWTNPRWAQGSYYVAFDPNDGNKAVAQIIDYDWGQANWFHAALYSTDGGATWTTAGGLSQVWDFGSRIELAYAPSDPNTVYAACAADGGKIWRSTDGGHSYTLRTTSGSSGCNWYANPLWVDPTNPNMLLTAGVHIFKSTDGGVTLRQISNGYILTAQPHPDIHCFVGDPGFNGTTNRQLYVGTDGGVHRASDIYTASTNSGSGWVSLQGTYVATQFYGAAGDGPTGRFYGGTQDNGTLRAVVGSQQAILPFGGDGGFCAIDPVNPAYCYGEYIDLQIHRSTDGGQTAGYIYSGISDAGSNANFVAPFILDSNDPNRMLAGGASLWRSNNVRASSPSWAAIRPPGSDKISAIAVAPGNADVIWIGQNDGQVYRTTNGTAASPTWITVDDNSAPNPLPNRYVLRILIDPNNSQLVYVGLGGFSEDNLWKTTDGGTTWSRLTGNAPAALPSAPVRGIGRHPQRATWLYVATEVGIYESVDGGSTWSTSNRGPANVCVDELVFMNGTTTLLAATHGRGLWTADVPARRGDLNGDGQVSSADFTLFAACLAGPGVTTPPAGCDPAMFAAADLDADTDVDLADFALFQAAFTGN